MKVTIFGMGYVSCVTAACLADHGHDVTGVDVDGIKVEMINHSQSSIIEPGLTDLIKRGVNAGRLGAATDTAELGSCVSDLRWHAGFELIEEDARRVNMRGLNLADRFDLMDRADLECMVLRVALVKPSGC